jgi:hypothetical protein
VSRPQNSEPEALKARRRELSVPRWPRSGEVTMREAALAEQTLSQDGQVSRTVQPST